VALLVVLVLRCFGFSGTGPVLGNVDPFVQRHCLIGLTPRHTLVSLMLGLHAARLQSKIGNVVAGSLFAIAQSIAMRRNVRIAALLGGVVVLGVVLAKLLGPVPGDVDPFMQRHCLIELIFVPVTLLCYWMLGSPVVGLQAWTGNVVARSLFAIAQSIAMRRNARIAALLGGVVVLGGASSVLTLPLGPVPGDVDPFVQRHCLIELTFVPATFVLLDVRLTRGWTPSLDRKHCCR